MIDHRIKQFLGNKFSEISEMSNKFSSYYTNSISVKNILAFLLQFNDYQEVKLVYKLLKNINYLNSKKITHLLKQAVESIELPPNSNYIIAPLGTSQDSSALVCYSLFKEMFSNENIALEKVIEISQLEKHLLEEELSHVILIDDNITSGTQLNDFFKELLTHVNNPELIKKPLSKEAFNRLKKVEINVCYAIQLTKECETVVDRIITEFGIDLKLNSGSVDFYDYTSYSSPIIDSEKESTFARMLIENRSLPLYSDKNWDKQKLYDRLLGYGNLGKLTVFNHNVPKSLIPFFWKFGNIDGRIWIPIFPERQEHKKIKEAKLTFDPFIMEVASSISSDTIVNREPEISFLFDPVYGTESDNGELVIDIPNDESISKVNDQINRKSYHYEVNELSNSLYGMGLPSTKFTKGGDKPYYSLSDEKYQAYLNYIDAANDGYNQYYQELEKYLEIFSTQGKLNIDIHNSGIGAANNLRFHISFNSGDIMFIKSDKLIRPYWNDIELKRVKDFEYNAYKINKSELYSEIQYDQEVNGRDLGLNSNLVYHFTIKRLSHKDRYVHTIDYLLINRDRNLFKLKYKLMWDESIEGIEGELVVNLNKIHYEDNDLQFLFSEIEYD